MHYGTGIFEGIRAYKTKSGPAIFKLKNHTDRLFRSAHILNMKIPFDKDTLNQIQCEVVTKNNLESSYNRPICFFGAEDMSIRADNLKVHVVVAAWARKAHLFREGINKGIRVRTSSYIRHHINSMMCKAKATGNYMNSTFALQEAISSGYHEALLSEQEGFVTEGSCENIFLVRSGKLITPYTTSAQEGITRETI